MFDYPTVAAIARHVATLLAPAAGAAAAAAESDAFLASLLDGPLGGVHAGLDLTPTSGTAAAVALTAVVVHQPAGIMAGGDPTRRAAEVLG